MKHYTLNIILGIAIILLGASCSKHSDTAQKPTTSQVALVTPPPDLPANNIFSLSRDGEKVTLTLNVDFPPNKGVVVYRNLTRNLQTRITAGIIQQGGKKFEDIAPDAKGYWYWIKVMPRIGASKMYGPIKIASDAGKTGKYALASKLSWTATRTQTVATITWDLPEDVSTVIIRRNTSNKTKGRADIFRTKEWKGDYEDTLPAPEADQWYWIEARYKNGSARSVGPIKAEYISNEQ